MRAEFTDPAQPGFCATLPIGMTLVAACLQPHAAWAAQALWWLLASSRDCLRWPFGAPWWAFTFPVDGRRGAGADPARIAAGKAAGRSRS